MMGNAFSLAILTAIGGYIVYQKLPVRARHLLTKYSFLTDLFALVGVYVLFGGTVTALMAGAIVSIIVSLLLHIAAHPDDYEWVRDIAEQVKSALLMAQEKMKELNNKYKDHKKENNPSVQNNSGGSDDFTSSTGIPYMGAEPVDVAV